MTGAPDDTARELARRREAIEAYRRHWNAHVARWRDAAGRDADEAEALVAEVLERGIEHLPARERALPAEVDTAAAMAVVQASGMLDDPEEYVRQHRLKRGTNAVRQHVEAGWRLLANPSPRFDLWTYWVEHLDPTAETVDPLQHWLLWGRHHGLDPVPALHPPRLPASVLEPGARRVCLFAAHDRDGLVDDYVVTYLRELARHADVYYLADGVLEPRELDKLAGVTAGAWSIPHGRYDFGSFSLLAAELVGWDRIEEYDELLLANDSCFLVHPLDEVFATMSARECDWWSLQATSMEHEESYYLDDSPLPLDEARERFVGPRKWNDVHYLHLSSYFLAFRRPVLTDPGFRWRLDTVAPQAAKSLVVHKYEVGISRHLMDAGYGFDCWLDGLHPFHPLYSRHVFDHVEAGFPLVKRNYLGENPRRAPLVAQWREILARIAPTARLDEMAANIERVTEPARMLEAYDVRVDADGRRRWVHRTPEATVAFRRMDRESPSHEHWWAFPTDAAGRLDAGQRAVLDAVRDDPSLRKVVLTRTRRLADDVGGAGVEVVPVRSHDGQEALVRCGVVVLADSPVRSFELMPVEQRHRFVHVGRNDAAAFGATPDPGEWDGVELVAVETADVALAARAASGLPAEHFVATGLPRHDLLLADADSLPHDLRGALALLEARLDGRPLVLLAHAVPPALETSEVAWLGEWARRHDVVLGVGESRPDQPTSLTRALAPLAPLGLQPRSPYPQVVVHRLAAAAVADVGSSPAAAAVHDVAVAGGVVLDDSPGPDRFERLVAGLDELARSGFARVAAPARTGAARRFATEVRERGLTVPR